MKRSISQLRFQWILLLCLCLALIWVAAGYELYRSQQAVLHEAEVRTSVQAHVFAEYSRSTIKRIDEFILDIRTRWSGDWEAFSALIQTTQQHIDDLVFQVAVIDKEGFLAFSNLAKPTDRTDLGEREHFRVHRRADNADLLFISKPLKGKVSGKWSIQLTRPIFRNGVFDGVVVVSVSPYQFAGFALKLRIGPQSVATVVRNTGEITARYPAAESGLGMVLKDRPFLSAQAPPSGSYRQTAAVDGKERIFGFYTLREYGMTFVLGDALDDVLAPWIVHRDEVLAAAASVSILVTFLFVVLLRSLVAREAFRQQLGEIFDLSPDGFVSFDGEHRVMYASPAFTRLTGLQGSKVTGLDEAAFSELLARACMEQARFPGVAALRAAQQAAEAQGLAAEHAVDRDAGGRRHLIELADARKRVIECGIRISNAATVSQILYFRDMTHEAEVDRLKSEFLSTAAHELRTPMTTIYGFAELLLTREFDAADRRDFLETIVRQSKLTVSILNELLDLVRIEERRGKDFVIARIDLRELLREIAGEFGTPQGRTPPAEPASGGPLWVRADRGKLMQAVSNVLSNAYKYSSAGAVRIDLAQTLRAGGSSARACIRIADEGIGMTPEQLARAGERFYRADTSGKIPGTGLGMSIVREIIQLHGGEMELSSTFGAGTTVSLWIPADEEAAP